jgi:hypothetical protein
MPDTFNDETNVVLFDNVVIPDTFNDDIHVVEPFNVDVRDTFKLLVVNVDGFVKLLIYVNNVVDVAFKLVIDNVELVDSEFKLLKMVVDVLFKLVILEFIVNTDKPDAFTLPTTFNVDKHVAALFNVVAPDTFNVPTHVVFLFSDIPLVFIFIIFT